MGTTGIGHIPGGLSVGARLALLEMEAEHAQYRTDCMIRDAAREAKRHHNERQVEEMRNKANALMTQAFVGGALQVAAGGAQLASVSSRLEAGQATIEANGLRHSTADSDCAELVHEQLLLRSKALDSEAMANRLCAVASLLNASADTAKSLTNSVAAARDADATAAANAAEDARSRAEEANESARRRLSQLDQKLDIIQRMLEDDANTRKTLLRG